MWILGIFRICREETNCYSVTTKQGEPATSNQTKNNDNRNIFCLGEQVPFELQIAGYRDQWPLDVWVVGGAGKVHTILRINGCASEMYKAVLAIQMCVALVLRSMTMREQWI